MYFHSVHDFHLTGTSKSSGYPRRSISQFTSLHARKNLQFHSSPAPSVTPVLPSTSESPRDLRPANIQFTKLVAHKNLLERIHIAWRLFCADHLNQGLQNLRVDRPLLASKTSNNLGPHPCLLKI